MKLYLPLLLFARGADLVEVIPRRRRQLAQRRLREVVRRRRQFGTYFSWFNNNSQLTVNQTRHRNVPN